MTVADLLVHTCKWVNKSYVIWLKLWNSRLYSCFTLLNYASQRCSIFKQKTILLQEQVSQKTKCLPLICLIYQTFELVDLLIEVWWELVVIGSRVAETEKMCEFNNQHCSWESQLGDTWLCDMQLCMVWPGYSTIGLASFSEHWGWLSFWWLQNCISLSYFYHLIIHWFISWHRI